MTVTESFYGESYPIYPICYHTLMEGSEVVYSSEEIMNDAADGVVCKMEADLIASLYNSLSCPTIEP
jgi:hypothetical protein